MPPITPAGQTWVRSVDQQDDKLVATIEIYGYESGTCVHITGEITQETTGAFAFFSKVRTVRASKAKAADDTDGDEQEVDVLVPVTATLAPGSKSFDPGAPIAVVARASQIWATVLGPSIDPQVTAPEPQPTWIGTEAVGIGTDDD